MKFNAGDETDQKLCLMLRHEYLRCGEALADFKLYAQQLQRGEDSRAISYRAYNAYARFILHLYEFILACDQRVRGDTAEIKGEVADGVIAASAQIAYRRATSAYGAAPYGVAPYGSGIDVSVETLKEFGKALRLARNTAMGHVKHERAELSLSKFYGDYHRYLLALHRSAMHMWGSIGDEFPDLGEITAFSVLVKGDTSPL